MRLSGFSVNDFVMHRIGFFVCRGYDVLDLGGPLSAFNQVATAAGHTPYNLQVISQSGGPVPGNTGVSIETRPIGRRTFDTVIFVGGEIEPMRAPENIAAARKLGARASRVASVCTGAFLLAETGLLDGVRATTHWLYAAQLQSRFPRTRVEGDSIYIEEGRIWTSAGIASGIDLALGMIERDMGAEIARAVSRYLVVPYRRPGGQSQFSAMSQMEPESDRIRIALNFAREHLAEALPVERLADAARLSVRQFGRAFRRETGETPAKAVERLRVEAARLRLQSGSEPIEQIALAVGFTDPERMRRAFIKLHGHPPQAIRRESRSNGAR
ncbi:AraC family transcriptional regulator [Burkholderia cepacia]